MAVGFLVPFLLFFFYLAYQQVLPAAYTSILRDSIVANAGKGHFSPLLALSPFPLVYLTDGGVSLPWLVNSTIWVLAAIGLVILWKKQRKIAFAMTLYFAFGTLLLFMFPVPFIQYFIPLTVMASILVGFVLQRFKTVLKVIIVITIITSFFIQYRERIAPGAGNSEQLQVLRDVLAVSGPDETFYDMVGSYVFRPDGYFICCHPYGEFIDKLSRPAPTLRESLVRRQTKFLVMDRVGFVFWQTPTPDLSFLLSNYLPTKYNKIYSLGVQFRCQNGACVQPGAVRSTNFFTILVAEKYSVTLEPNTAIVIIDGKEIRNGQTRDLASGVHRFSVSTTITEFRVQLDR